MGTMVAAFASRWQGPLRVFLLLALAVPPARADQVGFEVVSAPDSPGEPLKVGIWYPTRETATDADIGMFTQKVAKNAKLDGHARGLIVMSHGNGGSLEGHYDTALALARSGFVVAAMTHTGDNHRDQSRATMIADRPRAVHAVIDYMLTTWPRHAAIDPVRIGVFGFSSGAFTALVSVGGVPDLTAIGPYCASHGSAYVCQVLNAHPIDRDHPIQAGDWIADRRIKAAVVAAPAIGFTFSRSGLRTVRIPIQLWRAGDDHILPSPDYAESVRHALPRKPEYHVVSGADHFDFLAPCSDALAYVAPDICKEHGGFDRVAFHQGFNREVIRFFRSTLR
jgi:predicted dienelactone hydrolase